jgi:hypothetical protein
MSKCVNVVEMLKIFLTFDAESCADLVQIDHFSIFDLKVNRRSGFKTSPFTFNLVATLMSEQLFSWVETKKLNFKDFVKISS